jgi:SAM-dependent methyltransferase
VTATVELSALDLYGAALTGARGMRLEHDDGRVERLDVDRWVAAADPADRRLLDRCAGPVLDLGCGPGRLAAELAGRGVPALGVDLSARAVDLARGRGALAIRRDLFRRLPGEGRWRTALLADGNIGIGGDPERLLRRVRGLLAPGGTLLVEVAAADVFRRGSARIVAEDGRASGTFAWAATGKPALLRLAVAAGWHPAEWWADTGRHFLALVRG